MILAIVQKRIQKHSFIFQSLWKKILNAAIKKLENEPKKVIFVKKKNYSFKFNSKIKDNIAYVADFVMMLWYFSE